MVFAWLLKVVVDAPGLDKPSDRKRVYWEERDVFQVWAPEISVGSISVRIFKLRVWAVPCPWIWEGREVNKNRNFSLPLYQCSEGKIIRGGLILSCGHSRGCTDAFPRALDRNGVGKMLFSKWIKFLHLLPSLCCHKRNKCLVHRKKIFLLRKTWFCFIYLLPFSCLA